MGGFIIDTNDPDEKSYIPDSPELSLTANGVAILAELGELPQLSKEFIDDKSKADNIAKILVLMQVSWFIIQSIGRMASHLPLALLEVTTIAHIICAFMTYGFWWHKPLDIRHPTKLSGKWVRPLCASMWMFGFVKNGWGQTPQEPEIDRILHYRHVQCNTQDATWRSTAELCGEDGHILIPMESIHSLEGTGLIHSRGSTESIRSLESVTVDDFTPGSPSLFADGTFSDGLDLGIISLKGTRTARYILVCEAGFLIDDTEAEIIESFTLREDEMLFPLCFGPKPSTNDSENRDALKDYTPIEILVNTTTAERWRLTAKCLKEHPELWREYEQIESWPGPDEQLAVYSYSAHKLDRSFVNRSIPNNPWKDLLDKEKSSHYSNMFSWLSFVIYGAIHAAAWNEDFPTNREQLYWRVSSVCIIGFGLLMPGILLLARLGTLLGRNRGGLLRRILHVLVAMIGVISFITGIIVYLVSRSFLLVQAFITLRKAPVAMYRTPEWTQLIPHF